MAPCSLNEYLRQHSTEAAVQHYHHYQRATLHAISVSGPVTGADLARTTGLIAAATANIPKRLLKERFMPTRFAQMKTAHESATPVSAPESWLVERE
jgi:hypothetical protein